MSRRSGARQSDGVGVWTCAVSGECQMLCVRRRIKRPSQHDGTVVAPATGRRSPGRRESRNPCWRPVARGDHRLSAMQNHSRCRDHGPWPVGRSERVRARLSCREPDRCAGWPARRPLVHQRGHPIHGLVHLDVAGGKGIPRRSSCVTVAANVSTEDRVCSARCGSQGSRSGPRKRLSASRIGLFQDISQASFAQRQTEGSA
jgi:hypothetical protein